MLSAKHVKTISNVDAQNIQEIVAKSDEPLLLKGLVSQWPSVQHGLQSADSLCRYLLNFYQGKPVVAMVGESSIEGRFYYNETMTGFNFERKQVNLKLVLQRLLSDLGADSKSIYVGATSSQQWFPGFSEENQLSPTNEDVDPLIWIGNESTVTTHYDSVDNIACCVAGKRKFTLIPMSQLENLYVGPLEFNMAGQPVSLVNLKSPDQSIHPKFSKAMEHALVADLEPGDALYLPPLWWHHVESLSEFNVLANYWWDGSGVHGGNPLYALMHAMMTIRDLPEAQRNSWKDLFEHYVFKASEGNHAHIPEHARGCTGELTPAVIQHTKKFIKDRL
ncbi:cupin-like domain-containing protein [Echinimonas agarilytica]|uniref:Cupin-like domain-containing protein n=1 Tax=Echinimonas agarilytica TaxID=1215918 RepID=A0AA41W637_9GAMM|nr:cupin-like domain-containing protein [Echinimonas agarilytica]MCM2679371.1 cupin-like domain-containing protein [Echinimonas agarilytica]